MILIAIAAGFGLSGLPAVMHRGPRPEVAPGWECFEGGESLSDSVGGAECSQSGHRNDSGHRQQGAKLSVFYVPLWLASAHVI